MLNQILESLPSTDKNIISILSGGLDSTTLIYLLNQKYPGQVIALSFNYNQKHNIELEMANKTCEELNIPHKILNIGFFGDLVSNVSALSKNSDIEMPKIKEVLGNPQPVSYVPYRNMLFATLAMSFAEANNSEHVFLGVQTSDLYGYWDTTPEFITRLNQVSALNRMHQIKLLAPFVGLKKREEIELGIELKVDYNNTWSCYNGDSDKGSCATCTTCAERIKAFAEAGIPDPIKYSKSINWLNLFEKYQIGD